MNAGQLSFFDPVRIPLTKGQTALIDPIDADLLSLRWCAQTARHGFYVARRGAHYGPYIYLHRVVLARVLGRPLIKSEQVDHINGDGLDNRRANLRLATSAQNNWNSRNRKHNTSGYRGVTWARNEQRWLAQIVANGKRKCLGYFKDPVEAARTFNRAVRELHGEFARINEGVD